MTTTKKTVLVPGIEREGSLSAVEAPTLRVEGDLFMRAIARLAPKPGARPHCRCGRFADMCGVYSPLTPWCAGFPGAKAAS